MKKLILALSFSFPFLLAQNAKVGDAAPTFTLPSASGKALALSDFKGKTVVLEWYNKDCPFVKKHYATGSMQATQDRYRAKGVVWLAVISSAPGSQGHLSPSEASAHLKEGRSHASDILVDESGSVGKAYGAKTTPHMFVISPDGKLAYTGAIDDRRSTKTEDLAGARNHVAEALDAILAGKPVATPSTTAYGCSVKYGK